MDISVIFQDDQMMVIDKPPGLVVDPSETQKTGTLADSLQEQFGIKLDRGGIVHRLDKDTSGLLVVAKTQESLENLQFQFKERMVKKEYVALVHGNLEGDKNVDGAIARNPARRENFIVIEGGKEAQTQFSPIKNFEFSEEQIDKIYGPLNKNQKRRLMQTHYTKYTLVSCSPQTGRTHQIRVHLKYLGFPIVADERYGGRKTIRMDHRWCPRQFLHAAKLTIYHPITGNKMEFESPLPEDLSQVLESFN